MIREAGGQFCKREKGAWFEVGDRYARVKGSLRDMLHTQYRSSARPRPPRRRILNRSNAQTPQDGQVADGTGGHSDDSSTSPSCSGSSTDWGWIILDRLFDIDVDSSDIDIEVSTVDQTDY
jgi:hypothetical protein